ncbi:tRNA-dihydrouridine synthase family protein [uncultured Clostridium sp.]|uniref:tRNA dihydrouridine synthase n=1 Tax=uncultured Clostridium sp. TaxID=59620 RepID=UPI002600CC56|nr:tRNA-dihydrouridine synthase family protein [uncultured Clostridium sp.]
MKYYFAPMEGITGYIYRNAYAEFFDNIDKYFTPFIIPNESRKFKTKELIDVLPENNINMNIVPQILTDDSKGFINTSKKLQKMGYNEVNLNLGCPSGTVVGKGRGSGFLARRDELERFLDDIFEGSEIKISIKTRIGKESPEEFYELIKIYNKYPMEELIIHPRTRKDFYGNKPNLEVFKDAMSMSRNPICYNGDIFTVKDHDDLCKKFPQLKSIMIGRGILANPGLMKEINGEEPINKDVMKSFHDKVLNSYLDYYPQDIGALFKMKELWSYNIYIFSQGKEYLKEIRQSNTLEEYKQIVSRLFDEQEIIEGAGLFNNRF